MNILIYSLMDILVTVQTKNLFAVCHFLLISFRLSEHTLCSLVSLLSNKATQVSSIQERCMSLHSLQTEKKKSFSGQIPVTVMVP